MIATICMIENTMKTELDVKSLMSKLYPYSGDDTKRMSKLYVVKHMGVPIPNNTGIHVGIISSVALYSYSIILFP